MTVRRNVVWLGTLGIAALSIRHANTWLRPEDVYCAS
jgi:hypothetical protein